MSSSNFSFRYTCNKVRGWDVRWEAETLPSCCSKGSTAFPDGTMMVNNMEDAGCLRRQEECVVEDGRAMVVRTLTKLCCGPGEGQKEFVQWFHFKETVSGRLLDLVDGSLHLAEREGKRDRQKWRIKDERLLNKEHPNKAVGMKGEALVLLELRMKLFCPLPLSMDPSRTYLRVSSWLQVPTA